MIRNGPSFFIFVILFILINIYTESHAESNRKFPENVSGQSKYLYVDPVISALRVAARNDSKLIILLDEIKIKTPVYSGGVGNAAAYITDTLTNTVDIDIPIIMAAMSIGKLEFSSEMNVENFFRDYMNRYREAISLGTQRPNIWYEPENYLKEPIKIQLINELGETIYDSAIAYIVLHEVAHHYLGHLYSQRLTNARKREQEFKADIWAFSKMQELEYPIIGALKFMSYMGIIEKMLYAAEVGIENHEEYDKFTLEMVEKDRTHPLWKDRHARILKNFYTNRCSEDGYWNFRIVDNFSPEGKDNKITTLDLSFPKKNNAKLWGASRINSSIKELNGPAWVSYESGSAVLYAANGTVKIVIKKPNCISSDITIELLDFSTKKRLVRLSTHGWSVSFSKYGGMLVFGLPLQEALSLSPYEIHIRALKDVGLSKIELEILKKQLLYCQNKQNQIILSINSGNVKYIDGIKSLDEEINRCSNILKSNLGRNRYDEYRANFLSSKVTQSGLTWGLRRDPKH